VRRALTITATVAATIVAVGALLFIPLSLMVGHPQNVVVETALLVVCVWYVARVMRADRRARLAAEAALPPERRPVPRAPRRPITFQLRETVVVFAIWWVLVFAFDAVVLRLGPLVNIGAAVFAAFVLATLTVTGRHMMFRLTAEDATSDERLHPEERDR
jgi:FtsH-binding integral membrane protein